jgi:hypothetical protein
MKLTCDFSLSIGGFVYAIVSNFCVQYKELKNNQFFGMVFMEQHLFLK